jgi:glycosyltransferase involved in cell wall biosynthesis
LRDIVINGRFLTQPVSGVQRYAREIVRALDDLLVEAGPSELSSTSWTLLAPPGTVCDLPLRVIRFRAVGWGSGHAWEQSSLAFFARRAVLLSLGNSGPLAHPRQLVVVHDAAVYRFPEHFGRAYGLLHRLLGRALARRSRLATVSRFSQGEIADLLGLSADQIVLAPNGSEHLRAARPGEGTVLRSGLDRVPYFLMVGNFAPYKNGTLALQALRRLGRPEVRLVVVGRAAPEIFGAAAELAHAQVILAGRVDDDALQALYRSARALVFPSRYEGFGIPPLEAFVNGCPVIASRIPVLQEICGDAADYFDPDDADQLASCMAEHLDGRIDRRARIQRGRDQAAAYSWTASARTLRTALDLARAA